VWVWLKCANRCEQSGISGVSAVMGLQGCGYVFMCMRVVKAVDVQLVVKVLKEVEQSGIWVTCVYGGVEVVMGGDVVMSVGLVVKLVMLVAKCCK